MATIGVRLSLTLNVGEREFFRPEVSIEDIDPSLPLEPQIEAAVKGLAVVFDKTAEVLFEKVREFLAKKEG